MKIAQLEKNSFYKCKGLSMVLRTSIKIQPHGEVGGGDPQIPGTSFGKSQADERPCISVLITVSTAVIKHHD